MSKNYGETIRFYLVDVKDIVSDIARSQFSESELEQLADKILSAGCLLSPLLLKETGPMRYEVLERHFEYYAAVRANEKDEKRFLSGMVSAFVVKPPVESVVIEQAKLLGKTISDDKNKALPVTGNSYLSEVRMNNLESRLDNALQDMRATQAKEIQRLEESVKQLQSQIPKRLAPLEALNTLDIAELAVKFKASGVAVKKAQEVAKRIVNERKKTPFSSLKDLIQRKAGLTDKTMVNFVDLAFTY